MAPTSKRVWVMPDEVKVGDVLPDPHFSGKQGLVTKVVPAWYGCAVYYNFDGGICVSAVWSENVETAIGWKRAGIEVLRDA